MIADLLLRVLAAAAVGFAAGWLIKSIFARSRFHRAERSWQRQLEASKGELEVALRKAETLEPRSRQLEQRNKELENSFAKVTEELETIRGSFAKREQSNAELRDGLRRAQQNLQDTGQLRAKLAAQENKLKEMAGLRSQLFERARHLSELDSIRAERDTLSDRATELASENANLHRQVASYDEQLTLARERISNLEATLQTVGGIGSGGPAQDRNDGAAAQIARLEERLKERNAAVAEMRGDLDRLAQNYQRRIREMERRMGGRDRISISARIDAERPPTLNRIVHSGPVDDMTEISGVGPVLEATLKSVGIHSYQQLACLKPEDIERFGAKLAPFKSRIVREDWVGQARRLHEAKYGSKTEH